MSWTEVLFARRHVCRRVQRYVQCSWLHPVRGRDKYPLAWVQPSRSGEQEGIHPVKREEWPLSSAGTREFSIQGRGKRSKNSMQEACIVQGQTPGYISGCVYDKP